VQLGFRCVRLQWAPSSRDVGAKGAVVSLGRSSLSNQRLRRVQWDVAFSLRGGELETLQPGVFRICGLAHREFVSFSRLAGLPQGLTTLTLPSLRLTLFDATMIVQNNIIQNLERDIEVDKVVGNLEWQVSIQHTIYSFENPNLSSSIAATSFVGITEKDRFRFDASIDITWEFINNLDLQFSVYYNYDNKSLEGKTTQEDYGTVISLLIELK
jgi:hypothetical protein